MRPRSILLLSAGCGIFLAGVCAVPAAEWALARATGWLVQADSPVRSDMIVVMAGGSRERVQAALELYRAGLAPALLITGQTSPEPEIRFLVDGGVPPQAIEGPPRGSSSTWEEAQVIRQVIVNKELKSILVVTSPYHCRRVRLILKRVLAGCGVDVAVTASTSLYMNLDLWWRSRQGWITVAREFPALLWAWATVREVPGVDDGTPLE